MTADLETLRSSERRLQHELAQRRRRETSFMLRIAVKEREACEAQEALKRAAVKPQHRQVETLMLDPAMAGEIRRLREELKASQKREAALRDELEASQFQSGSIAGKKLVQKCRELQSENEQLGKDVSEGRMQQLRAEVGMHKDYASEQRKSIGEMREWIEQLSDELEVAQGTIFSLRRELKDEKAMRERSSRD
mmetsp:Transcript_11257/g.33368  ORF Transcript_11257/g.33368 Transcript_11257/m.33368 type:complete len:194 (+) Transcript_11257:59-640(+)|eukprot:CAMPEP_0196692730 /NCGR_PEP_ID=MMETSP1090-20130531/28384_1 /TAXON_ID=37098 /ORGANISM="Isochrysis sp, Strain CCMP1244" /LENGTH=193 /DNA_ID=CAMNT_0042032115 /DNA_START=33 /DNA_END=614 /DNA_ORIENTATION=+